MKRRFHDLKSLITGGAGNAFLMNSGWLMGEQIYRMILSLVLNVFTARFLGPANMGILTYATTFAASFMPMAKLSMEPIVVREIVSREDKTSVILGSGIFLRLISSSASVILMIGIVALLNPGYPIYVSVTLLNGISLIFQSFFLIESWLQAHLRSKYGVMIKSIGYTAMSLFKIYLLASGKSVQWFAFAVTLDMIMVAVLYVWFYFRKEKMSMSIDRGMMKYLIKQSFPFVLSALMLVIYGQVDRIVLQNVEGDTALGLYGVSAALCYTWQFVPTALITSATPLILKTKESDVETYKRRLKQLYAVIWWLSVAVSMIFTLFGEGILVLLFGESYRGAAAALRIFTWSQGFSLIGGARSIWFLAENKNKYLVYCHAISAAISVVINLTLISAYGITGAAVSVVLTQFFVAIVSTLFFKETRPSSRLIVDAMMLKGV